MFTESLVTLPQLAEQFGVSRQALISIKNRYKNTTPAFPEPALKLGSGGAYDRESVLSFFTNINWLDDQGQRMLTGHGRRITAEQMSNILDTYKATSSIRKSARAADVSEPTVRNHLIKSGLLACNCACHK